MSEDVTTFAEVLSDNEEEDDFEDYDEEVGEFLDFEDRDSSCEETETEIASIEKVHSMTLQHIKERILRTVRIVDAVNETICAKHADCQKCLTVDFKYPRTLLVLSKRYEKLLLTHSELEKACALC